MKRRGFLGAVAAVLAVPALARVVDPHRHCAGHLVDNETGERTCVARITATGFEVKEFTDSWMSGRPHTLLIAGHETDWFHLTCWHGVGPRLS